MVFNNAEYMGVPWETIIKTYRKSAGNGPKATCKAYLHDFLGYIESREFCGEDEQDANLVRVASDVYAQIHESANNDLRAVFKEQGRLSTQDRGGVLRNAVGNRLTALTEIDESISTRDVKRVRISPVLKCILDTCIDREFRHFRITQSQRKSLHRIFQLLVESKALSRGYSGVVIAGFGVEEMFPAICAISTDGMVAGKSRRGEIFSAQIGQGGTTALNCPFGQREMVDRFMEGVDPEFLSYLQRSTVELLYRFGEGSLSRQVPEKVPDLGALRNAAERQSAEYFEQARSFLFKKFVGPIVDAVRHLPKEEMAGMAEALVNLTSLKRRVSLKQETVGGPIDSAVISKGDGFVWIKGKHYFTAASNPEYFVRQSLEMKKGDIHGS